MVPRRWPGGRERAKMKSLVVNMGSSIAREKVISLKLLLEVVDFSYTEELFESISL